MDFGHSKSQLLNDSPGKRQRSELKHDTVGPFQLGLSPSALRKGEKILKWSELSTGGKGSHFPVFLVAFPSSVARLPFNRL
jgi:import inner membrane translocase subunit TIM21